ncbi:phage protein NinX family protein [Rhodoferax antarcticus]|uniref:phage protein NinX family protein n=1 Tax=Rhodoferax antarcticus TaxID=81479 RepID=UPI000AC06174|nr:phage protein NinX family protein [Rhodoferax antarcticus]
MIQVNTNCLNADALNWAVAKSIGFLPAKLDKWKMANPDSAMNHSKHYVDQNGYHTRFDKLNFLDWSIGGPLCERQKISACFEPHFDETGVGFKPGVWKATILKSDGAVLTAIGATELEAKLRCLVLFNFGDFVRVPKELV